MPPPATTAASHGLNHYFFYHPTHTHAQVPLQRITVFLPPDHTVAGISFVLRSADRTMWYKDAGGGDFFVPVPGKANGPVMEDPVVDQPDELCRAIVEAEASSAWTLMHR